MTSNRKLYVLSVTMAKACLKQFKIGYLNSTIWSLIPRKLGLGSTSLDQSYMRTRGKQILYLLRIMGRLSFLPSKFRHWVQRENVLVLQINRLTMKQINLNLNRLTMRTRTVSKFKQKDQYFEISFLFLKTQTKVIQRLDFEMKGTFYHNF